MGLQNNKTRRRISLVLLLELSVCASQKTRKAAEGKEGAEKENVYRESVSEQLESDPRVRGDSAQGNGGAAELH